MARKVLFFICFYLLLSACTPTNGGVPTLTAITSVVISPIPTQTATLVPSATPLPSKTLTPPTLTPKPISECPPENSLLTPDFPYCTPDGNCQGASYIQPIINFLNKGGTQKAILHAFYRGRNILPDEYILAAELTGDKTPEFIYSDSDKGLVVLGCGGGQYKILLQTDNPQDGVIDTHDLNKDGLPELTVTDGYGLMIYEWDGFHLVPTTLHFQDGKEGDVVYIDGKWNFSFQRAKDQTYQIILQSGYPSPSEFRINGISYIPYRLYELRISWDGEKLSVSYPQYTSAEYRFQAIQDADIAILEQKYDAAIDLYQQAIFSNKLGWWSLERRNYLFTLEWKKFGVKLTSIVTKPLENNAEYKQLAAYAYYRMVILHTNLGEMDTAKVKYATLQEKFPAGNPGHPYVEMATDFWNAYQSSDKMYDACAAAIAYAAAHPEILTPLGSDYHGAQSHTYVPADVCPFR